MKLAVFSNQNLNPWVNWTTLGPPLLNPLASNDGARLICPPELNYRNRRAWAETFRGVRSSDTVFWMQGSSHAELPIHIASLLRIGAHRSVFVVDAWKYLIKKIGIYAIIQRLNPCFVAFREGYRDLRKRFPLGHFEWLPFGVDTSVFDSVPGKRPIFAYWMGRRYEPLHQAMIRYCLERGLEYRYTQRGGEFPNPFDLGRLVGQSKYFLVTPPNLADPVRTAGYSPFVMRYLEGLAAGARLVGVLPGSGEYEMMLPLDAILQVAPDGSDLAAKLDVDRENLEADEAVERARLYVREHHSWARRAQQIFDRLSSGKATGFDQN